MSKIILIMTLLLSGWVHAEEPPEVINVKKSRRIKLQFEENLIKGKADSPETSFLNTKDEYNYKKLIKIRENFIPEVEASGTTFKGK